jgi:hypothetical protein
MEIDFRNLECFLEWLVRSQVRGVFAVCQSSEMFFLSLRERLLLARKVSEIIKGRVPVLGSGHVSAGLEDQKYELEAMADTGIDALVLVVNRIPSGVFHDTARTYYYSEGKGGKRIAQQIQKQRLEGEEGNFKEGEIYHGYEQYFCEMIRKLIHDKLPDIAEYESALFHSRNN